MEKTETIIYGGAFNPPTVAHECILSACVDQAAKKQGEVWLIPSGDRRDKQIATDRQMRIDLIKAMIQDIDTKNVNIEIITTELDRSDVVETIDTVYELNMDYPDRRFIWVFGADSIATMSNWRGGDWLLQNLEMLVIERPGYRIGKQAVKSSVLDIEVPVVSSTDVRLRLEAGDMIEGMVGPAVEQILLPNKIPRD